MKQHHTDAELANDASLRYCPYRRYEAIWSDVHQAEMRFVEYVGPLVRLATINGMGHIPELVKRLQIRRLTAFDVRSKP